MILQGRVEEVRTETSAWLTPWFQPWDPEQTAQSSHQAQTSGCELICVVYAIQRAVIYCATVRNTPNKLSTWIPAPAQIGLAEELKK